MATPPQGTGNSNDIQGAPDALVSDTHRTDPDIFLGPRLADLKHHDQTGISKTDRDRVVKVEWSRAPGAAFNHAASGFASGPGYTLTQDFKRHYMG
ncbi:hypothetical protein E4U16_005803 [Claviceps sp. LM84 group G4]|nr:hypothetical protein E4U16_005803 [Claviceps sp. LM84 group G4]